MKSNLFEFFAVGVIIALFIALGFELLMMPARTEFAIMADLIIGIAFVIVPLFMAATFGAEWINDNISRD